MKQAGKGDAPRHDIRAWDAGRINIQSSPRCPQCGAYYPIKQKEKPCPKCSEKEIKKLKHQIEGEEEFLGRIRDIEVARTQARILLNMRARLKELTK